MGKGYLWKGEILLFVFAKDVVLLGIRFSFGVKFWKHFYNSPKMSLIMSFFIPSKVLRSFFAHSLLLGFFIRVFFYFHFITRDGVRSWINFPFFGVCKCLSSKRTVELREEPVFISLCIYNFQYLRKTVFSKGKTMTLKCEQWRQVIHIIIH